MDFNFPEISIPALFLVSLTGITLVIGRDKRWLTLALGVQYIGVFMLVYLSWPLGLAIVKLVAGLMSLGIISFGFFNQPEDFVLEGNFSPSGRTFRVLTSGVVVLTMVSIAPSLEGWFVDTGIELITSCLVLVGLGLLHIGLTSQPMRVIMGLLTFLSGFEILFASIENSVLIAGMLAVINLGTVMAGIYLVSFLIPEESP